MKTIMKKQRGAILVMTALLVILLLGMAALALDLGRLYVQKTEMQNAADTAARAGAMELNGQSGALARAEAAINNLLQHQAHFSRESELLDQLSRADDSIVFYSWVGSNYDATPNNPATYCTNDLDGTWQPNPDPNKPGKCVTDNDFNARYVEVRLYPELVGDPNAYTIDLFFLPVLRVLLPTVADEAAIRARAVAGRHFFVCNYPPVMFCNPFEPTSFAEAVATGLIEEGYSLALKYQSNFYKAGNFAFLVPRNAAGQLQQGAKALGDYLANPDLQGCTPPIVRTQTGTIQSHPLWAWNTRFDTYRGGYTHNNSVPAPNVMEYPQDLSYIELGEIGRFGQGNWARDEYWGAFHSYHAVQQDKPAGYSSMTRWELYNWELEAGYPGCDPRGQDGVPGTGDDIVCYGTGPNESLPVDAASAEHNRDPWTTPQPDRSQAYLNPNPNEQDRNLTKPIIEGLPAPNRVDDDLSVAERRVLFVAVIDCESQGVSGSTNAVVGDFAKFFMLQTATTGSGGGGQVGQDLQAADFVVEFIGPATEKDAEYHVEILLYE
jgi:hypothetical protein